MYDGNEHELIDLVSVQSDLYYSFGVPLNKDNYAEKGTLYSETSVPKATNAGDYTIYYYVTGTGNYSDASGSVLVLIDAISVDVPTANNTIFTYDGNEHEYLPTNWENIRAKANITGNKQMQVITL